MPSHYEAANPLYVSKEWRRCREAFLKAKGRLCERCLATGRITPATQVHHKIRVTAENLHDPSVTLDWSNLEALCTDCHTKEHTGRRWSVDEDGSVDIG